MTTRVGTWQWLLWHELRLMFRESRHYVSRARMLWTFLVLHLLVGLLTALFVWELSKHPIPANRVIDSPQVLIYFLLLIGFLFSSAIKSAVVVLFDGGDIELLLCSPVSSLTIFVVRLLRVAASSGFLLALVLLPAVNVAVCMGQFRLLAVYPVLASLLLTLAGGAMLLTLGLVRCFGAKIARQIAQITAVICGSILFIVIELPAMLNKALAHKVWMWIQHSMAPGGWLGDHSLLRYPLRAAWGQPLPFLICLGTAVIVTAGAIRYLGKYFSEGLLVAQSESGSRSKTSGTVSFTRSLGKNLLVKEWRLMYRDPFFISRLFRELLFMIPGTWILLFKWHHSAPVFYWLLGGVILLIVMTLTSGLAWLTVCGEDAPTLLGCAPVSSNHIKRYKVLAALLPAWLICLPIVIVLIHHNLYVGVSFGGTLILSSWSFAIINVWMPRLGNPREFGKRRRAIRPDGRRVVIGMGLLTGWGFTYYFLAQHSAWACLALAVAVGSVEGARRVSPRLERQLAY